ncbi:MULTISPECIES: hypothetical protein [Shewanella]|uniref:Uncharacterized protein n=1 Tax=Shewanella holmiensis TaxID=2952222 RepID=A0A9X3ATS2_9GAMM|nr:MULTISPECIES: hypothetical protein [Shewanella]MCT7940790.1 hypothetical protein [Shewanella holmiensis]MDP5147606.1 hypothetical protein [Shewanella sp. ULN5]
MKPDRSAAMKMLIAQVLQAFPLDNPELAVCGSGKTCEGCPKKLLEIVDSEIRYWQSELDHGETPTFGDIEKLAKLCKNVNRGLKRNGIIIPSAVKRLQD